MKKESLHKHLRNLNNLSRIKRCPGIFAFETQSVSEHSFKVMQYAQFFGNLEAQHGNEIDFKLLYEKVLNHDVPEILIGDIPTPVKYKTPEMRAMVAEVEELMVSEYVQKTMPKEFKELSMQWLGEGKDDSIEGNILKFADKLDQVYEAFEELQKGNTNYVYVKMYKNAVIYLLTLEDVLPNTVKYFKKNILEDIKKEQIMVCNLREITDELLGLREISDEILGL